MVETLLDKPAVWLAGDGPDADIALMIHFQLSRNLADYPFPEQCARDEKRAVEERVLSTHDSLGLTSRGQYCSLEELDRREGRFLVERGLIRPDLMEQTGPRGVYISNDQSLSIVINSEDHLRLQCVGSGLAAQETWQQLNALDDQLITSLDFAFSERLGFLTTSVHKVGTGLVGTIILHLPALAMMSQLGRVTQLAQENRHRFNGLYGGRGEGAGDIYRLTNMSTLGQSEEEIVFHLRHLAKDIVEEERKARVRIQDEMPRRLEDRIGRAQGVARGARLLEYTEALDLLSALRLGLSLKLVSGFDLSDLNEVLLWCQNAHLETRTGQDCDELTISTERADMFRGRFSAN